MSSSASPGKLLYPQVVEFQASYGISAVCIERIPPISASVGTTLGPYDFVGFTLEVITCYCRLRGTEVVLCTYRDNTTAQSLLEHRSVLITSSASPAIVDTIVVVLYT